LAVDTEPALTSSFRIFVHILPYVSFRQPFRYIYEVSHFISHLAGPRNNSWWKNATIHYFFLQLRKAVRSVNGL